MAVCNRWTGPLDWTTGLTFQPILAQSRSFSLVCLFAKLVAQRLHGYTALVIWSPAAPLALQIAIEVYIIIITACAEPSGDTVVPIFTMSTSRPLAIPVLSPLLFMPSPFAFSVCNHWTGPLHWTNGLTFQPKSCACTNLSTIKRAHGSPARR